MRAAKRLRMIFDQVTIQSLYPSRPQTNARTADGRTREVRDGSDQQGPDEDVEHVWDAEAESPTVLTEGFQIEGRELMRRFRYREMVWEQRNSRYWGRWRWTEWEGWEAWHQRVEDGWERAIRAWKIGDTPQEILLRVIECLVGRGLSFAHDVERMTRAGYFIKRVEGLGNLALVCRSWYTLIAPALYSRLRVTDEALQCLNWRLISQHARCITVRSKRPSVSSATAARLGPRPSLAVGLVWQGPDWYDDPEAPYHPSHAAICAEVHRSYSNVVRLGLQRCTFLSSSDLLRLLASFSALQRVDLSFVTVRHVSDSIVRRGLPSTYLLRRIHVGHYCMPPGLPFLSHSWAWPCELSHRLPSVYHELLPAEQRFVARICGVLGAPPSPDWMSTSYHLDVMDIDDRTWVASMILNLFLHLEFHASQDTAKPGAAHIRHFLLRMYNTSALTERLTTLGDTFLEFAFLETVVLETGHSVGADIVQPILEALQKVFGVEVQHRTCAEAHQVALQAKSPSGYSSAGLLSPVWCLEEHAWSTWEPHSLLPVNLWLSHEYWKSLKDEDRQGWDPSRPPATPSAVST